jgi:D-sedoheptulose 7-phosphate isomerase
MILDDFKAAEAVMLAMQAPDFISQVEEAAEVCVSRLQRGSKLMFAGNGGSAADAQHWAAELIARFNYDRPSIPAIALTTDTSALTAIGNDYGYRYVFSRQIEGLGTPGGDVLIVISTSGNSENILEAISSAKAKGIYVIGLTGKDGGQMKSRCNICIIVPSNSTPHIQEGHTVIGHAICSHIESKMYPK